MDNEISATSEARQLLTLSLKPQELYKHRAAIGVEVEAALNNGGYWREPSSQLVKMKMLMKWMDALQNYSIEEIEKAFAHHVMKDPKRKPNEGLIYNIIIANRRPVTSVQTKAPETYVPVKDPITPEAHAKLMEEFGSPLGKVKSFNANTVEKT